MLAATVAVCCFLGALGWYLRRPGYTTSRLVFFAILSGAGVLALYGIVTDRGTVASAGIVARFLLGFWQAVLWFVIYPVIAVLLVAMLVGDTETTAQAAETD
ncbi:hypothetical protein GCM10028857_22590 [Salinarchaeum chitinilyticum]